MFGQNSYDLNCTGPGGSVTTSVTVTVNLSPVVSVAISPSQAVVEINKSQQFTATVLNTPNAGVKWFVNGVEGGNPDTGTITASGLYQGPNQVPIPQNVTIRAVSQADPTKSATASVAIWRTIPTGKWDRTGPPGSLIVNLAEDVNSPGTVYAGANFGNAGGIWKSTDFGVTWNVVLTNTRLDGEAASDIAVVDGGRTIMAAGVGGVFIKSTDRGVTWTQRTTIPWGTNAMAVSPNNSSIVYASLETNSFASTVVKSVDGGGTWTVLASAPSMNIGTLVSALHAALLVDPRQSDTVYYGTDHGLFISRDGGLSWSQSVNGFAPFDTAFRDIVVHPADPSKILALVGNLYASLYQSTDGGNSWNLLYTGSISNQPCVSAERIVPDPFNVNIIYLYGLLNRPVYKSTDGGRTFAASDSGMGGSDACSQGGGFSQPTGMMLPLMSAPGTLLATVGGVGIYRSLDAGQSWSLSSSGISGLFGSDVAVDLQSPTTVYLAAEGGGGLWKSLDSGLTWNQVKSGSVRHVAVDPFDSSHILAVVTDEGPLLESINGGGVWQNVTSRLPQGVSAFLLGLSFHPARRGTIFVGGATSPVSEPVGLMRSIDGGMNYVLSNAGLPATSAPRTQVAVNPRDPDMLFFGTTAGVYKSIDGGNSWSLKTSGMFAGSPISSISVDAQMNPPVIYAAGVASGFGVLHKSVDLGENWTRVGVTINLDPRAVSVDPSSPNSIFLVSNSGSAGWSPDGGVTWLPLTNGLGHPLLTFNGRGMVIARSSPQVLFVISIGHSILRLVIGP